MELRDSAAPQEINDNKALSIVLPITLITIAVLVMLVGVLVYLLVRKQKAKKDVHPDSGYSFLEKSQQSLSDEHSFTVTGVEGSRYIPCSINTDTRVRSGIIFCHGVSVAAHVTILLSMMLLRHETRQSSIVKKVDNPIYGKDRYSMMHHFSNYALL